VVSRTQITVPARDIALRCTCDGVEPDCGLDGAEVFCVDLQFPAGESITELGSFFLEVLCRR